MSLNEICDTVFILYECLLKANLNRNVRNKIFAVNTNLDENETLVSWVLHKIKKRDPLHLPKNLA